MNAEKSRSIGSYINSFFRMGVSYLGKEYKHLNIGAGQYQFLIQLYLEDGISHEELTERMSVDKATTTRAIDKLQKSGYVEKILNKKDKRKYKIYLTDYALGKREEVFQISKKWEEQLTGNLNQDEKDLLLILLRKMGKTDFNMDFE